MLNLDEFLNMLIVLFAWCIILLYCYQGAVKWRDRRKGDLAHSGLLEDRDMKTKYSREEYERFLSWMMLMGIVDVKQYNEFLTMGLWACKKHSNFGGK